MINTLQSFRVCTSVDELVRDYRRNPFSVAGESDEWLFEQRTRRGEIKHSFAIMRSTAELALRAALQTQKEKPELVRVELEHFAPIPSPIEFNPYF